MTGKDAPKWVKALAKEYSSLAENNVFSDPLPLPIGFVDLMAKLDYDIDVADVVTAFLLTHLKEEIYICIS